MHFKHVDNQSVSFVGLWGKFLFINTEYVINWNTFLWLCKSKTYHVNITLTSPQCFICATFLWIINDYMLIV